MQITQKERDVLSLAAERLDDRGDTGTIQLAEAVRRIGASA